MQPYIPVGFLVDAHSLFEFVLVPMLSTFAFRITGMPRSLLRRDRPHTGIDFPPAHGRIPPAPWIFRIERHSHFLGMGASPMCVGIERDPPAHPGQGAASGFEILRKLIPHGPPLNRITPVVIASDIDLMF